MTAKPWAEPWTWTAAETAAAIASGRISSREATASVLARMEEVNSAVNAVVDPMPEEALAAAEAADAALAAGQAPGVLHGVPMNLKINVDYGGRATTNGVVAFKDLIAPEDGSVTRSLKDAGAVIVGRTNVPAFSMRWFSDNDLHGRTLNPYDPGRTPGGSSGGAAAATAVGIGAIGHGNDLGGSVRYPAYCCGLYGLRPTAGLAGAYNPSQAAERPIVAQMASVQGPLARSVADIRLGLRGLCAPDPRDIWQIPFPPLDAPGARRPCRVAVVAEGEGCPTDPSVSRAIERAAAILERAGYEIVDARPPSLLEAGEYWRVMLGTELYAGLWPAIEEKGDDAIKIMCERGHGVLRDQMPKTAAEFLKAYARRSTLLRDWRMFFADCPLLLTATSWAKPHPIDEDVRDGEDGAFETFIRQQYPSAAPPILGLPGLAAPMGTEDGLPTGVQLLADRFGENLMLAAAEVLELANGPVLPIDPVS